MWNRERNTVNADRLGSIGQEKEILWTGRAKTGIKMVQKEKQE